MAFFELLPGAQMAPEAKEYIEIAKQRHRTNRLPRGYYAMAKYPRMLKAFVQAFGDLIPLPNRFGTPQFIASMLIAHAKRCGPCFHGSREFLVKIGMDDRK